MNRNNYNVRLTIIEVRQTNATHAHNAEPDDNLSL